MDPLSLDFPIVFQKPYELSLLTMKDKTFLLAKEKRTGSLDNFVQQVQVIQKQIDTDQTLFSFVINCLTSRRRNDYKLEFPILIIGKRLV